MKTVMCFTRESSIPKVLNRNPRFCEENVISEKVKTRVKPHLENIVFQMRFQYRAESAIQTAPFHLK